MPSGGWQGKSQPGGIQLTLPIDDAEASKFERFLRFHRAHPEVYAKFRDLTLQVFRTGRRRIGSKMIWERLRWFVNVEIDDRAAFKLNDHFLPYFALLLMLREPHLAGVFETRGACEGEELLQDLAARTGGPA